MPSHLVQTFPVGGDPTGTRNRLLARDGNERLWFAHTGWDGVNDQIWVSYSDDDGWTWTSEQITNNPGPGGQRSPAIAVDSLNNIHLVWDGYGWGANPAQSNIQYRRRTSSGWEAQIPLTDDPRLQAGAAVVVDSKDNVYITWTGEGIVAPPANDKIFLQIRTLAGWQPIEVVINSAAIQHSPALAIGADDILHIVWQGRGYGANPGNYNIQYRRRTAGWAAIEAITDVAFDQDLPHLALDSQNNIHVAWVGSGWGANPGVINVQYRKRTGVGWGVQEAITDMAAGQENAFLSLDTSDNVYVSWEGTGWGANPAWPQILYRQKIVAGWQPVVLVTDDPLISSDTNVLWASNPTIGGLIRDMPETGLALVFSQDTPLVSNCYYYYPPVFSWPEPPPPPEPATVATLPATHITEHSARIHGMVQDDGGHWGYVRFQWGGTREYGAETPWLGGYVKGDEFYADLTNLTEGMGYHFRAQFKGQDGRIVSGQDMVFNTLSPLGPVTLIPEDLAYLLEAS